MHFDDGAAEAPGRPVPLVELRAPSRVGEAATGRGRPGRVGCGLGRLARCGPRLRWRQVDLHRSFQTIYPKVHETPLPMRCVGSTDHVPGIPREHSVCTSLSGLGEALGVDFSAVAREYSKKSTVAELRVFGCTLGSQRVVHYATRDPDYLSRIETDAAGICVEAAHNSMKMPREDDTRPLPGHMRFGNDHDSRLTTGCGFLSSRSHILARTGLFGTSRLIQGRCSIEDVGIGILWSAFAMASFSYGSRRPLIRSVRWACHDVEDLPASGPLLKDQHRNSKRNFTFTPSRDLRRGRY